MARKLNVPKTLKAPVPVAPIAEDEPGVIFVPRVFHARARLVEQMRIDDLEQRRRRALEEGRVRDWWWKFLRFWSSLGGEVAAVRHYQQYRGDDYEPTLDSLCGIYNKRLYDQSWTSREDSRHKYETDVYKVTCRRCLQALLHLGDCAKTQWDRLDERGEENGKW